MIKRAICIFAALALMLATCGCTPGERGAEPLGGLKKTASMELRYASQFAVDYYEGGFKLISLADGSRFLLVPEGGETPRGLTPDVTPLQAPLNGIYLAAAAAMCLFDALERLDAIAFSGIEADGWYVENAAEAMRRGDIRYAGRYNAPDYEMMLADGCPLALASTMIERVPEVVEKLESLGTAVLVDRSSMEPHPLGRVEWVRLYGALLGEEARAEELLLRQISYLEEAAASEPSGTAAVFFRINPAGTVMVPQGGDYITKMIELAGGSYLSCAADSTESGDATANVEMETFFAAAREADCVIYNASIGSEPGSIDDILALNGMLGELPAVREGNVWCAAKSMFQDMMQLGRMIQELQMIFSGEAPDRMEHFYKLY